MIKHVILIAFVLFVAVATLCQPLFLASNLFINKLVDDQLLSLLAVVLTITFASVANIHFLLNQIVAKMFADVAKGQAAAATTRKQINDNAWWLFWAFVACCLLLIAKGVVGDEEHMRSALNGACLLTLLGYVLVFYDIYRTVFALASSNVAVQGGAGSSKVDT